MKAKRILSLFSALLLLLPVTLMSGCSQSKQTVLRVYNWEEYIDEGGEDSYYDENANHMVDDFEAWYEKTYQESIRVEYSTFGTNEDLYNQLKLGNKFDLVCPSEYMIMKLAAEGMLEELDESFFDETNENNFYINNVSPFIQNKFEEGTVEVNGETKRWADFAAGYMWGTTGLVYNPQIEGIENDLKTQGWGIMLDKKYAKKLTTKDNVRDSYFVGLAIAYRDELLALDKASPDYNRRVTEIMNRIDEASVKKVQDILLLMKANIFGFETDTGKSDIVKGNIYMNFAWSGDAVYAMDLAEADGMELSYYIPEESANLFFDGWVMPKGANKKAAQAFMNFMSMPENAVRNTNYIGYSSVIAGEEMLAYAQDTYGADEDAVPYDVSYFFGEGAVIMTSEDQITRQLYAQYPPEHAMTHCAVMDYYGDKEESINELWTKVKGESLAPWAIAVLCVSAALIALGVVFTKFGNQIEWRPKPKKGYKLIEQTPLN